MIPTAEEIISASGFHPSRVFCIYILDPEYMVPLEPTPIGI